MSLLHADRLPPPDVLARLVSGAVASRIANGDTSVWPFAARPGWVHAPRTARPLVGAVEALRERLRVAGVNRVVLAAAGGVGVAAEAIGAGPRLIVLDTTDPAQVADALAGDLDATVLVVSAPPGEDVAALELVRDTVARALRAEGLDPDAHTVVVAAPDGTTSGLPADTVLPGDPAVDGPWSALSAYALVPAGLAGLDVGALLADARSARAEVSVDSPDNPALILGALLAGATTVALTGEPALAEHAAQLVAGGLGKHGRGPLPVVVEGSRAPGWDDPETLSIGLGPVPGADATTFGPPGAQVLLWQHAVAVAAHLLDVDPSDRPDSVPVRDQAPTGAGDIGDDTVAFVDGAVAVHATGWLPPGSETVADALRALVAQGTHLAVHAYLDRESDASAAVLRSELARRTGLATTFGWAPRCLPGAGQHAKGGPDGAVVCQLTGTPDDEFADPFDDGFSDGSDDRGAAPDPLAVLQEAQARDDAAALAERGRPVLRLHFTDRVAGLVTVARAVQQL